jgi:hypothetical protein
MLCLQPLPPGGIDVCDVCYTCVMFLILCAHSPVCVLLANCTSMLCAAEVHLCVTVYTCFLFTSFLFVAFTSPACVCTSFKSLWHSMCCALCGGVYTS